MHRMLSEIHKNNCNSFKVQMAMAFLLAWCVSWPATGQWQVDPPSWWANLEDGRVELLVSSPLLDQPVTHVSTNDDEAVVKGWRYAALPGHTWVSMDVSRASASKAITLTIEWGEDRQAIPWTMHGSLPAGNRLDRWEESPAMYLIMPDRFANGDPSNDTVEGMREQEVDRTEMYARHGGDLRGIQAHLPYLKELGVGAIWLTPVVENDLAKTSYHGYACTDGYAIDRRLGSLDDYKSLAQAAHAQGIRMVHDWVPNHWGNLHRLLTHPVDSTWVNRWSGDFDESKRTNYRGTTLFDPYGTDRDVKGFNEGWFDRMMPDMNQTNEDLQRYMGTNMLWLMAEVGIDGLRIDTYTYGNAEAMARMTKRIANAFPRCFMFAEAWVYGSAKQAALVEGSAFGWGQETGLDGAVDFAWHFAMQEAVHQGEGWERGIGKVYEVLAEDFLYPDANRLVTFLDNHDTHRWIAEAGDDDKARAGLAMLLLGRGMPCLYYGTELGFRTRCEPDGKVRQDMPGGWAEDTRSAFLAHERTSEEQAWHRWVKGLLDLRNRHSIGQGTRLEHGFPKQGVYAFAQLGPSANVVVVVNASDERRPIPWPTMEEWVNGRTVQVWSPDKDSNRSIRGLETIDSWETLILEASH